MSPDFCTLFDSAYLPRGLALYESLLEVEPLARLRVLCMDERTHRILDGLALPGLAPIPLGELERADPELAAVKPSRSRVEYCWTATPCITRYCLAREPALDAITYVDADVMFFSSPSPLFAELGDGSVQIVPHRYAPQYRHQEATSGIYNVEWVTFKRDAKGLEALDWWRERCIEWCYDRLDDGKLGDQMYLDDWPERFEGVEVLRHIGGGLAPWNVANYSLSERGGRVWVDDTPLVFFHYHSLKLARRFGRARDSAMPMQWSSRYPRSTVEERVVWRPYLACLSRALARIRSVDPDFDAGFSPSRDLVGQSVRRSLGHAYRRAMRLPARLSFRGSRA